MKKFTKHPKMSPIINVVKYWVHLRLDILGDIAGGKFTLF